MAAGQGFKTFASGDILTAADVNGYLMQGVNVFADATERDAEIASPQEGQFAYLKDTDALQYYSGSVWTAVGGGGGITSANNYADAFESTSSTSYTALTTAQSVTLTTGTKVLVLIGCTSENDFGAGLGARMSYSISGATTVAANDDWSVGVNKFYSDGVMDSSSKHSYQTVTAGSNTFTAVFKRVGGSGSANFQQRTITVIDLGS